MKLATRSLLLALVTFLLSAPSHPGYLAAPPGALDGQLRQVLVRAGFTGRVESTLEQRLGRPIGILPTSAAFSGSTRRAGCTPTTPAAAVIPPRTGSATASRWRSGSRTTISSARID